jgi:hypothetical protein
MGALAAMAALVALVPIASADEAPPSAEADPVLAIVSPIALPVCTTAGTATLLVPILGGLVQTNLALGNAVNIGDVILDAIGPVYVVCGALPAAPGTRCLLDDQIAALFPADLTETIGPAPNLVGGLVDSLLAGLRLLGLDVTSALQPALQCNVRETEGAPDAPPGVDDLPAVPGVSAIPTPSLGGPPASLGGVLPATNPLPPAAGAAQARTLIDVVQTSVPGWVEVAQVVFALLLVVILAGSWTTSLRSLGRPG